MNWNTFFTRAGTALIFVIIMLTGLLGHSLLFFALFLLIQFLSIKEYFSLMKNINPDSNYSISIQAIVQVSAALFLLMASPVFEVEKTWLPALLFIPAVIILQQSLSAKAGISRAFESLGALLYICLPIVLLMLLREKSLLLPLGLIILIWVNDTMAYIVGSFIGKTPFSSISPKKTWEGTIGGAVLTVACAVVFGIYSQFYTVQDWVVLALCAAFAGTLGDLFESKLKRVAGVKDSGTFMPGHGGALDRFDSLLVAAPFAYCYAYLFMEPLSIHIF